MAISTLKKDNDFVLYRTIVQNDFMILEVSLTNEHLAKSDYIKRYYIPGTDEQKFHVDLRKNEIERYESNLSTNHEWDCNLS